MTSRYKKVTRPESQTQYCKLTPYLSTRFARKFLQLLLGLETGNFKNKDDLINKQIFGGSHLKIDVGDVVVCLGKVLRNRECLSTKKVYNHVSK